MRFLVLGRLEVMFLDRPEPHAVISIREPGSDQPAIPRNEHCRGILRLSFHDVDREADGKLLFTAADAREILAFVTRVRPEIETLVVHCEAGISRSAGVAAALAKVYDGSDGFFFEHYIPNRLVYSTLLRAWQEGDS
jgi:predicted protein tyrosine phosphatase